MLQCALGSFILAIACGVAGFSGGPSMSSTAFQFFSVVFALLFLVATVIGLVRR